MIITKLLKSITNLTNMIPSTKEKTELEMSQTISTHFYIHSLLYPLTFISTHLYIHSLLYPLTSISTHFYIHSLLYPLTSISTHFYIDSLLYRLTSISTHFYITSLLYPLTSISTHFYIHSLHKNQNLFLKIPHFPNIISTQKSRLTTHMYP